MKRLFIGALVFSWGMIGVLVLTVLAALNPWDYNGISGMRGALLGMGITKPYVIFIIMAVIGMAMCIYEGFIRKSDQ